VVASVLESMSSSLPPARGRGLRVSPWFHPDPALRMCLRSAKRAAQSGRELLDHRSLRPT
jgi:hypothetical protein